MVRRTPGSDPRRAGERSPEARGPEQMVADLEARGVSRSMMEHLLRDLPDPLPTGMALANKTSEVLVDVFRDQNGPQAQALLDANILEEDAMGFRMFRPEGVAALRRALGGAEAPPRPEVRREPVETSVIDHVAALEGAGVNKQTLLQLTDYAYNAGLRPRMRFGERQRVTQEVIAKFLELGGTQDGIQALLAQGVLEAPRDGSDRYALNARAVGDLNWFLSGELAEEEGRSDRFPRSAEEASSILESAGLSPTVQHNLLEAAQTIQPRASFAERRNATMRILQDQLGVVAGSTVRRLVQVGLLSPAKVPGDGYLFHRGYVERLKEFLDGRTEVKVGAPADTSESATLQNLKGALEILLQEVRRGGTQEEIMQRAKTAIVARLSADELRAIQGEFESLVGGNSLTEESVQQYIGEVEHKLQGAPDAAPDSEEEEREEARAQKLLRLKNVRDTLELVLEAFDSLEDLDDLPNVIEATVTSQFSETEWQQIVEDLQNGPGVDLNGPLEDHVLRQHLLAANILFARAYRQDVLDSGRVFETPKNNQEREAREQLFEDTVWALELADGSDFDQVRRNDRRYSWLAAEVRLLNDTQLGGADYDAKLEWILERGAYQSESPDDYEALVELVDRLKEGDLNYDSLMSGAETWRKDAVEMDAKVNEWRLRLGLQPLDASEPNDQHVRASVLSDDLMNLCKESQDFLGVMGRVSDWLITNQQAVHQGGENTPVNVRELAKILAGTRPSGVSEQEWELDLNSIQDALEDWFFNTGALANNEYGQLVANAANMDLLQSVLLSFVRREEARSGAKHEAMEGHEDTRTDSFARLSDAELLNVIGRIQAPNTSTTAIRLTDNYMETTLGLNGEQRKQLLDILSVSEAGDRRIQVGAVADVFEKLYNALYPKADQRQLLELARTLVIPGSGELELTDVYMENTLGLNESQRRQFLDLLGVNEIGDRKVTKENLKNRLEALEAISNPKPTPDSLRALLYSIVIAEGRKFTDQAAERAIPDENLRRTSIEQLQSWNYLDGDKPDYDRAVAMFLQLTDQPKMPIDMEEMDRIRATMGKQWKNDQRQGRGRNRLPLASIAAGRSPEELAFILRQLIQDGVIDVSGEENNPKLKLDTVTLFPPDSRNVQSVTKYLNEHIGSSVRRPDIEKAMTYRAGDQGEITRLIKYLTREGILTLDPSGHVYIVVAPENRAAQEKSKNPLAKFVAGAFVVDEALEFVNRELERFRTLRESVAADDESDDEETTEVVVDAVGDPVELENMNTPERANDPLGKLDKQRQREYAEAALENKRPGYKWFSTKADRRADWQSVKDLLSDARDAMMKTTIGSMLKVGFGILYLPLKWIMSGLTNFGRGGINDVSKELGGPALKDISYDDMDGDMKDAA